MRKMKKYLILIASLLLIGCSTFPVEYPKEEGMSLIQGQSSGNAVIYVRNVDNGEINFGPGYRLRDFAWVYPGSHEVSFMCEINYSWGTKLKPAKATIQIKEGYSYLVELDPSRDLENQAFVIVKEIKH